jgi:hypothetical protein
MPFNTTDNTQPPFTNGVMELTEEEITLVKGRLVEIKEEFVPDYYNDVISTFYLTATYNKEYTTERINGDTCEMVMSHESADQPTPEEPVEEPTPTEPAQEEEPQGE